MKFLEGSFKNIELSNDRLYVDENGKIIEYRSLREVEWDMFGMLVEFYVVVFIENILKNVS